MVLNLRPAMCLAWLAALALLFAWPPESAMAAEQQMTHIGSFRVSGGELKECVLGFRTYGTLAADQSNAVLFPTWAGVRTAHLEKWIGPGQLLDSSKWYVIAVDALGNGVSCSPSNSRSTPSLAFPGYSIRDMVRAQHKILTLNLGIDHLHAIVGIGMGGMQALQWAVTYQDFADRLVLMETTAQPTDQDRRRWDSQLRAMEAGGQPVMKTLDTYRQLQAVRAFDLLGGGDMATLARKIKARILVISSASNPWVEAEPARLLARQAKKARYLVVDRVCGDPASGCDGHESAAAVARFLGPP